MSGRNKMSYLDQLSKPELIDLVNAMETVKMEPAPAGSIKPRKPLPHGHTHRKPARFGENADYMVHHLTNPRLTSRNENMLRRFQTDASSRGLEGEKENEETLAARAQLRRIEMETRKLNSLVYHGDLPYTLTVTRPNTRPTSRATSSQSTRRRGRKTRNAYPTPPGTAPAGSSTSSYPYHPPRTARHPGGYKYSTGPTAPQPPFIPVPHIPHRPSTAPGSHGPSPHQDTYQAGGAGLPPDIAQWVHGLKRPALSFHDAYPPSPTKTSKKDRTYEKPWLAKSSRKQKYSPMEDPFPAAPDTQ